jgi:hypothetical protein
LASLATKRFCIARRRLESSLCVTPLAALPWGFSRSTS